MKLLYCPPPILYNLLTHLISGRFSRIAILLSAPASNLYYLATTNSGAGPGDSLLEINNTYQEYLLLCTHRTSELCVCVTLTVSGTYVVHHFMVQIKVVHH